MYVTGLIKDTKLINEEHVMRRAIQIWLIGMAAAMGIASAPGPAQAQAGQPGLRIVGPAITKQLTQRTIAIVRLGMQEGSASGAKGESTNTAKAGEKNRQKLDVKTGIVDGK